MQTVEEFLAEYFEVRTELIREAHRRWEPYARRFFVSRYDPWGYGQSEAENAREEVLGVTFSPDAAEVVTSGPLPRPVRTRYKIRAEDGSWRIAGIELECGRCRGTGKSKDGKGDCRRCDGRGWVILGNTQT
jgi:hypothetical protein